MAALVFGQDTLVHMYYIREHLAEKFDIPTEHLYEQFPEKWSNHFDVS